MTRRLGSVVCALVALVVCVCSAARSGHAAQPAPKKVLVYGPTYGGNHDLIISTPDTIITVWDAATWTAATTADFAQFDAIAFGDFPDGYGDCFTGTSLWEAAIASRTRWQAAITGNIVVLGTDPEFHRKSLLVHQAVAYAAEDRAPGPGLYVALSCAYNYTGAPTTVELLDGIGAFTVRSSGCGNMAVKLAPHKILDQIDDAYLSNWYCSTHEGFDSWPDQFMPLAVVVDAPSPNYTLPDGRTGIVYMLVSASPRGEWPLFSPAPATVSWKGWSMTVEVSADDGVVLRDVSLTHPVRGTRYMAAEMALPYLELTTTKLSNQRIELGTSGSGRPASRMVGYGVSYLSDRLRIEGVYRVDHLPKGSKGALYVTQRYEFFPEIDEKEHPEWSCEPSQNVWITSILSPDWTCARWRPIVEYTYIPQGREQIVKLTSVQRLHFTPDGQPLQGSVLAHDCNQLETGTNAEPCLFTLLPIGGTPLSVYQSPPFAASPLAPGISLMNNQNPLTQEYIRSVIWQGVSVGPDNVHATTNPSVQLPVPLPPGCPECVHIHWRWASFFGPHFGDGLPMIHNDAATDPFGLPTSTNPDVVQDVNVGLTVARASEADPPDYFTLATPAEAMPAPAGYYFWYAATSWGTTAGAPPLHDEFFNHGGFFSTATLGGTDLRSEHAFMPPWDTVPITEPLLLTAYAFNDGPSPASDVTLAVTLPPGLVVDSAGYPGIACDTRTVETGTLVVCQYPTVLEPGESFPVEIYLHATAPGIYNTWSTVYSSTFDGFSENDQWFDQVEITP